MHVLLLSQAWAHLERLLGAVNLRAAECDVREAALAAEQAHQIVCLRRLLVHCRQHVPRLLCHLACGIIRMLSNNAEAVIPLHLPKLCA